MQSARDRLRRSGVIVALLLGVTAAARAQNIQLSGLQGVSFGPMLPGISTVVSRADGARAALFDLKGSGSGRTVLLQFVLPSALSGPGGATLPLSYGASDAGFSAQQTIGSQVAFDPRVPYVATLSGSGRGSVYLGATAMPASNQTTGSYSATLTLNVIYVP